MKGVKIMGNCKIFGGVEIGEGSIIEGPCIIGKPPRGKKEGELTLRIGKNAIIRPFTTIYAGTVIGDEFQSGQCVSIREDNFIGDNVVVGTSSVLEPGNRIGNGVRIHSGCFLERVNVGNFVFIGPNTVFTDDPHPMKCPRFEECAKGAEIEDFVKIGANVTVLPFIKIGKNSLIGAGTVITKDVPADSVIVGNPGKVIKKIEELTCRHGWFSRPYLWPPYEEEK